MPFNPERLVAARNRRAKTQTSLAAECGVDPRNIRRYETGDACPSEDTLKALASALGFPREYFFREKPPVSLSVAGASFRSLSTMTRQQALAALAAGSIAIELSDYLAEHLELPPALLPDLHGTEPELAARQVRAAWGLGNQPLSSTVHTLEKHGVRVFSLVEECKDVDAFCVQHEGVPFVFLNTMKSSEHSRFDACHELAHLTLHQSTERRGRAVELEAHRFAAAFLMPRDDVLAHAPRDVTLHSLIRVKRRWWVSVIALARRLYGLELVRDWQYKQLCIQMSRLGYRSQEPQSMPREQSQLLRLAFELLKKKGIGRAQVASAIDVPLSEIDRLVFGLQMICVSGDRKRSSSASSPQLRVIRGRRQPDG